MFLDKCCRMGDSGGKIWFMFPEMPLYGRIPAEPGQLPLGILPGAQLDLLRSLLRRTALQQGGGHLRIANGLHGGAAGGNPGRQQAGDLLDQALLHHLVHPAVNTRPQITPVGKIQTDGQRGVAVGQGPGLGVVLRNGLARGIPDLQGPDGALFIVGVDAPGGLRVDALQLRPQDGQPLALGPRLSLLPQAGGRRKRGKVPPRHQRVQIQPGAAGHDGQPPPGQYGVHDGDRVLDVPGY